MANINPIFYEEGHEPVNHNTAEIILQKILGCLIDNLGGSGGGSGGDASAANQTLEIAQLTAINGKLASLGQKAMAGSVPVVIASDQSAVPVSGSVTVSGTVAATQSGTWTVQPGNTANTTAWKVDGSAVTQPISAASLPLPALAATSTIQTTQQTSLTSIDGKLGTLGQKAMAGSAPVVLASDQSAIPVTVASVPLPSGAATEATLAKLPLAQGSTTATQSGPLIQGAVTTAAPAYTTAQTSPLSLTPAGNLRVDGSTVTQPVSYATTGSGTATGALRVELPTNGTGVIATVGAVTAITNALPAGTNAIGKLSANSGVDIGDVTVDNAAGAAAVNIQDGGNSITVDYATTGSGTSTGALRVELPTNGTGIVGLATGSNTIGALTANQSTNIAQMNGVATTMDNGTSGTGVQRVTIASNSTGNIATIGTSVTPGTAATNLGKAEDDAHTSGDVGVMALAVRKDTPVNTSGAVSDYEPLQVSGGRLWVDTLMVMGTSYALTTTASSVGTTFTAGIRGITIYSRGSDAYFKVGTGAQTASSSTAFIAAGERIDIDMTGFADPRIAVIFGPAGIATVLQVSELT